MAFGVSLIYVRWSTHEYTQTFVYTHAHKCRRTRGHSCILSFTWITLSFLVFILTTIERKSRTTEFSCMFSCNARASYINVCLCRCICVYNGCTAAFFWVAATAIAAFSFHSVFFNDFKSRTDFYPKISDHLETNEINWIKRNVILYWIFNRALVFT